MAPFKEHFKTAAQSLSHGNKAEVRECSFVADWQKAVVKKRSLTHDHDDRFVWQPGGLPPSPFLEFLLQGISQRYAPRLSPAKIHSSAPLGNRNQAIQIFNPSDSEIVLRRC